MNSECKILDDEEIEMEEQNKLNFRRFKPEDLEKKYTPFERSQKKEFPFLFQKKRVNEREDQKISLEDIINKLKDLSLNVIETSHYPSMTPPYPPYPNDDEPIPTLTLSTNIIVEDETNATK